MLSGRVVIDDNPVTRTCLRNVELRQDFNGNVKPLKDSEKKKIDGVIAMLQALAAYMEYSAHSGGGNIY
jgi:phage terminase large subunit-like protein